MFMARNVIAVVFDFDDTLTDDSTTKLLQDYGVDTDRFWGDKQKEQVEQGWDPTLSYLKLILDNVGEGKPLGAMSNSDLHAFGAKLKTYPGVTQLFKDLKGIAAKHEVSSPLVEFYIISGGLEEVIRGSNIAPHVDGIWGCRFAEGASGTIEYIMNMVSFTEKTRYVFEINKGIRDSREKPYQVNEKVDEARRRVPLKNMIYVGDGLTDVPCFSLISRYGGKAFGVFDPTKEGSPKQAWQKLIAPGRVTTLNSPRYRKKDDLGALLRAAVEQICLELDSDTQTAV
jgi:phosphoserine phosphatase